MKILNVGSMNIDHVYAVDHFVRPGESLFSTRYAMHAGGKGFNQSIACARAGMETVHVGRIGREGLWLLEKLKKEGVNSDSITISDGATGHAMIQVVPSGENSIVVHGGANQEIQIADLERAFAAGRPGDVVLLQNETNVVESSIRLARKAGFRVAFNAAPMRVSVASLPLEFVDLLIVNETEAEDLTGYAEVDAVRDYLIEKYPALEVVLTLGERGAVFFHSIQMHHQKAFRVQALDTTAAGDTFIGYFLSEWIKGGSPSSGLEKGCRASAVCVTRAGASDSIPRQEEVERVKLTE